MKRAAISFAGATTAAACPLCHTETAAQIRAALLGPDLWFNLAVTVLPFVIFLMVTTLIYFGPARILKICKQRKAV